MAGRNKKNDSDKELRPTEILKRRRDELQRKNDEKHADLRTELETHIEKLKKFINQPEEVRAYIQLNYGAKLLCWAIDEFLYKELMKLDFEYINNQTPLNKKNYEDAVFSISEFDSLESELNLELFENTANPKLLLSFAILANYSNQRRKSFENYVEDIGIKFQMSKDKETGEFKFIPIDGTGDLDETTTNNNLFNWKRIEKFLPTLPTNFARLEYLINIWARFEKMSEGARKDMNLIGNFSHNCEVEIERLKELIQIEQLASKQQKTLEKPDFWRKRILDMAVRLYIERDEWTEIELIAELRISKSTFYNYKKSFGWSRIQMLRNEALEIIRNQV